MTDGDWFRWTLTTVVVVGTLATIASVDKPAQPTTRVGACAVTLINGLLLWGIWSVLR